VTTITANPRTATSLLLLIDFASLMLIFPDQKWRLPTDGLHHEESFLRTSA
jgi:hypothetical protein